MKPLTIKNLKRPASLGKPAFALVVTLSLMILLTIIALGLLSLSTISLRSSSKNDAMIAARSNARMAMMIAIGRLQAELGADQRISANAAITDDSDIANPQYLGVWDSWKAGVETSGNDAASHHQTIATSGAPIANSMHPTYEENREDHFREWLVSTRGNAKDISLPSTNVPKVVSPKKDSKSVTLVGTGTLGEAAVTPENEHIAVELVDVYGDPDNTSDVTGRYGFWVGDESQKARIMADEYELKGSLNKDEQVFRNQSPGSTATRIFAGLENVPAAEEESFERVATFNSLERIASVDREQLKGSFLHATTYSLSVLSDVRSGGLKKDLSTLLDQPINPSQTSDEYMLARFSSGIQDAIPIQDLANYYQLYRNSDAVKLDTRGYNVKNIDFLDGSNLPRESTNIYRSPVIVKLQFVVSFELQDRSTASVGSSNLRTFPELKGTPNEGRKGTSVTLSDGNKYYNFDQYRLLGGISPAFTLWNPYNVPLVLKSGDAEATQLRLDNMPISFKWKKISAETGLEYETETASSLAAISGIQRDNFGGSDASFSVFLGGSSDIVFQPGEVRVFSLAPGAQFSQINDLNKNSRNLVLVPGWDTRNFLKTRSTVDATRNKDGDVFAPNTRNEVTYRNSDMRNLDYYEEPDYNQFRLIDQNPLTQAYLRNTAKDAGSRGAALTFSPGDEIFVSVFPDQGSVGLNQGSAMRMLMRQSSVSKAQQWDLNNYLFSSPRGGWKNNFNKQFMQISFEDPNADSLEDSESITSAQLAEPYPMIIVNMMAGAEAYQGTAFGAYEGRKFPARPFLHSTPITGGVALGGLAPKDFYHHGWSWWVQRLSGGLPTNLGTAPDNRGYYGGGYTASNGTTRVVQQEIPLVPPISIGSLSHAILGGMSVAQEALIGGNNLEYYRQVRAIGQSGLFPHMVQAIGNSYAYPEIAPDRATGTWQMTYDVVAGPTNEVMVDQSYVANKALWDDYFFSSITNGGGTVMGSGNAQARATAFFDGTTKLPNTRMVPYTANLPSDGISGLFSTTGAIAPATTKAVHHLAAHMMVEGGFNVNSTSVEAWKGLFSSMRKKSVASLPETGGSTFDSNEIEDGAVSGFSLPVGDPSSAPSSASDENQWLGLRELTEKEIDELSEAMVEQVKERGPFLSLSEFVNRRLDSSNKDLAVKGALQAALDDNSVSINANFRQAGRSMSSGEKSFHTPEFPEALDGPISYGSAAYVDQADVLRGLAAQLTVRGDTFVIRAYGDALDPSGNVTARAWCEAVVQRTPQYLDPTDEDYEEYDKLNSSANKQYGRRMRVVQFRFLNPSEI
ncbi:hypothetical protein ACFSSA_04735 [Luteolibacter algae]|uniref:Tfp pilus assembly protein PilX n=1 Tax=Luteolibacter algae TaxID=454151 RepID=A0ABW5D5Z5_9BACT